YPDPAERATLLCESVVKAVAGLRAITPFPEVVLSGRLLEREPAVGEVVVAALAQVVPVVRLGMLPGAWVKQAAQGAALLADGLAGGSSSDLVRALELERAGGTVLDGVVHPRRP